MLLTHFPLAVLLSLHSSAFSQSEPTGGRRKRLTIVILCAIAIALRLYVAFASPSIAHPDEIYQNQEQAHRLVFGYGIVPWEFREGVRSWVLPGLLAVIFKTSDLIAHSEVSYRIGATVFLSLLSLAPVVCGFLWAWRLAGHRAAVITGGFAAVWFELVYFGPKSLTEVFAAHILIIGLYLAFPGESVGSRMRLAGAGFALGLAFALRIQLLPAFAVIAIYAWRIRKQQSWKALAWGLAAAFASTGLLDWITWGSPWQSMWKYFYINGLTFRSAAFGIEPWYFYGKQILLLWFVAVLPMLYFIGLGAQRIPLLAFIALIILAAHSLVQHKEYRFSYPAITILIILAGIGLSHFLSVLKLNSWPITVACLLGVACSSALLASRRDYRESATVSQGEIRAFREIAHDPQGCGIIMWYQRGWTTPGYTGLHRDIPIYEAVSDRKLRKLSGSGNYLVTRTPPQERGDFVLWRTFEGLKPTYVYRRPGGCSQEYISERVQYPNWFGDREPNDDK